MSDYIEAVKLYDPFIQAVRNGNLEKIKLLLSDPRIDPSAFNNHAIQWASFHGFTEIVKLLLSDPRVDPSIDDNYPIVWAVRNGHPEIVKLLLSDPRINLSITDIRDAADSDYTEVVKLLLSDSRVNWRDIDEEIKIRLLKDAELNLKDELKTSLLSINRITPKMKTEGEYKNLIPKSVRKNISYRAPYEELCSLIKGEIPPIKLVALANLLKIQYSNNISWKELRGKVKFKLLEML